MQKLNMKKVECKHFDMTENVTQWSWQLSMLNDLLNMNNLTMYTDTHYPVMNMYFHICIKILLFLFCLNQIMREQCWFIYCLLFLSFSRKVLCYIYFCLYSNPISLVNLNEWMNKWTYGCLKLAVRKFLAIEFFCIFFFYLTHVLT